MVGEHDCPHGVVGLDLRELRARDRWTLIAFGGDLSRPLASSVASRAERTSRRYLAVTQRAALSKMICIRPFLTTPVMLSLVPRGTSVISRYLSVVVERMFSVAVAYRVPVILGSLGGEGKVALQVREIPRRDPLDRILVDDLRSAF